MRVSRFFLFVAAVVVVVAGCPAPVAGEGEGEGEGEGAVDFGFVFVASEPELGFAQAGAVFRRALPRAFDCTETAVEGCVVFECGSTALPFDEVSAGVVDVVGALRPLSLAFDGGYAGVDINDGSALFDGGETLTATGAGAEVPAFSLQVTAPVVVVIGTPVWPAPQDVLSVTRASGLHLQWSGSSAGEVVVVFNTADQSTEVSCAFAAADGAADVPSAALLALPAGDGFVDIEQRDSATVRAETWELRLQASTHAAGGAQGPAIASAVFN